MTKDEAGYEHPAMIPLNNCGVCVHFSAPDHCDKVLGPVSQNDWCMLWDRKPHF